MRKFFILFILLFLNIFAVRAEVGIISVTDEDKHSKKEDFYHTFEYVIVPSGAKTSQMGKCQATRIARNWFVTAAHCVQESCKNGCEIQLDLLEYSPSAFARFTHTPKKPLVFVHPLFSPYVFAKNDFALLHLHMDRAPLTYYLRPTEKQSYRQVISEEKFNAFLEQNRRAKAALYHALNPKFPPILYFDEGNFLLDRKLSVIAIFDGKRDIYQSTDAVYYVKALGFAYTQNFGIRQGMSGSGVMSNTGELVGMASGNLETWDQSANGRTKEGDYFMFPIFNKSIVDFMKDTMGSDFDKLDFKEANPYCVSKTRKNFSSLIQMVKNFSKNLQVAAEKTSNVKKTGK